MGVPSALWAFATISIPICFQVLYKTLWLVMMCGYSHTKMQCENLPCQPKLHVCGLQWWMVIPPLKCGVEMTLPCQYLKQALIVSLYCLRKLNISEQKHLTITSVRFKHGMHHYLFASLPSHQKAWFNMTHISTLFVTLLLLLRSFTGLFSRTT